MQSTQDQRDKVTPTTNEPSNGPSSQTGKTRGAWKERAKEFFEQVESETGRKLKWVPVFTDIIEIQMHDVRFSLAWRLLAWVWRTSWGNYSLCCVEVDSSLQVIRTLTQRNAATEFEELPQRINEAVALLREMGYLKPQTGFSLVPELVPSKIRTPPDFYPQPTENKDTVFLTWWKAKSPEEMDEYARAQSAYLVARNKRRAAEREFKRENKAQKSAGPPPDTNGFSGGVGVDTSGQKSRTPADDSGGHLRTSIFIDSSIPVFGNSPDPPPPLIKDSGDSHEPPGKADEEEPYRQFKESYPKDHFDEPKAKPLFRSLSPADQRQALERLRNPYLTCARWQDGHGRWIPLASNFLKDKSYDADPPPKLEKFQSSKKEMAPLDELAEKLKRMREGT